MIIESYKIGVFVLLSFLTGGVALADRSASQHPHLEVEIISDSKQLSAGSSSNIGILFRIEDGWHLYWKNPGDTGLSPKVKWEKSESAKLEFKGWTYPKSIPVGHLTNFGYEKELLLAHTLTIDDGIDSNIDIAAEISWLVCKESCIPGKTKLSKTIEIDKRKTPNKTSKPIFNRWKKSLPQTLPVMQATGEIQNNTLNIQIFAQDIVFEEVANVEVFVEELDLVEYGKPVSSNWRNNVLSWKQALSEYYSKKPEKIHIVIVVDNSDSYKLEVQII